MRPITHIVLHCTATAQNTTIEAIRRYWREVMGWKHPGYHLIIRPDGTFERLAADEAVTNGVRGHNATSIHISYIGGVGAQGQPVDNRTAEQRRTMLTLVRTMRSRYPEARIVGHRDFPGVAKACPSFEVAEWLRAEGVPNPK